MHTQPTAIDLQSPVVQRALRIRAMMNTTDQELDSHQKETAYLEQAKEQRLSWNKLDIASTDGWDNPHSCAR